MRVLVSGSSGLIGSALCAALRAADHEVLRLVRSREDAQASDAVFWNPDAPGAKAGDAAATQLDPAALDGVEAVFHLAGENIGARWTDARMARIRDSRVDGTRLLARVLAGLAKPPRIYIGASAMGFYGDGGDRLLDETSPAGHGFLAEVCQQWEAASASMHGVGARVVHPRICHVLSREDGLLGKLRPIFKLGLGGPLGDGRQWMSWIALPDIVRAFLFCLERDDIAGPVNFDAPDPRTNADFTRALARAWHRPAIFPAPAWALRLAMGKLADEGLLIGQRIAPRRLLDAGFEFEYPTLDAALKWAARKE